MKLAVALLVLADLLLRGAAVPHVHATDASDHAQSHRPHVHVEWHSENHGHSHHEACEGVLPRHTHAPHADSHDHVPSDHTVIYLDGGVMLFTTADQVIEAQSVVSWIASSTDSSSAAPADAPSMLAAARPPGDRAASIHDLLPHVLRI